METDVRFGSLAGIPGLPRDVWYGSVTDRSSRLGEGANLLQPRVTLETYDLRSLSWPTNLPTLPRMRRLRDRALLRRSGRMPIARNNDAQQQTWPGSV